jgi:hypothetical protein
MDIPKGCTSNLRIAGISRPGCYSNLSTLYPESRYPDTHSTLETSSSKPPKKDFTRRESQEAGEKEERRKAKKRLTLNKLKTESERERGR